MANTESKWGITHNSRNISLWGNYLTSWPLQVEELLNGSKIMQTNYVCQCPYKSQENHAWQMYIILLEVTDKTSEKLNLQIPKGTTQIVWVICPVSPDMVTANNWASASLMVIWATKTLLMWDQLLPRLAYDWQRMEDRFGVLGRMIEPEDHWYYCW